MNRKACCQVLAVVCLMALTNCTSDIHSHISGVPPVEAIAATGGTPQSHAINSAFGMPLAAAVTADGSPMSGIVVTFNAPPAGATGTFADTNTRTTTATTNASGIAVSPSFWANGTAGAYTVTAAISGGTAPASFTLTNTIGAPVAITATGGTPQSTVVNSAFAMPLVATVVDGGQNPVTGAIVTFAAPATGASGIFADTASNTTTATTNASGVATSAAFTANATAGAEAVTATVAGASTPANFGLTNAAGPPATITATSGTPQTVSIKTAFAPLVATVLDSLSNPVSGVVVTFTAPASGATGTFANGTATETDTTDANGMATATTFTANDRVGAYPVTASIAALSTPATFSLTNQVSTKTYVFYLRGQEAFGPNFYALAGSVQVTSTGKVIAGEQDYNDGSGSIFTSPEPGGDIITGGTLTVDPTHRQGILVLNTNNPNLGVAGVETLGLQSLNSNHAQIIQFDGTATSSGSLDAQTLPATLSGGYAFTLSGLDNNFQPVTFGGVFSITGGTTMQNGSFDTNDAGTVTTAIPLSGTLSAVSSSGAFDPFGRGTITSTLNYGGIPIALNYYVIGPEAIRIIDVDPLDSAVGSAFGQGVNATTASNGSLGTSVFGIESSPYPTNYAAAGMLSTSSSLATFSGVADDNEVSFGILLAGSPISGTYSIANNGYGSITIASGSLGDVSQLGVYMTDPNLNLSDPNNTATGLGGALVADMDPLLAGGSGVLMPQIDTSPASFTGKYAFGAQDFNFSFEFDFVGAAVVTGGALNGVGLLSDPFLTLGAGATNSGVTFSGTPLPDPLNVGRYTMSAANPTPNPLAITINGTTQNFEVVLYQASGGQLFWLDEDSSSVFLGTLQQSSLTGPFAAAIPSVKTKLKRKP